MQMITSGHQVFLSEVSLANLRGIQFAKLHIATKDFSGKNIIGKGGFENFYKGYLKDGTTLVLKRLKGVNTAVWERHFQTEFEMISQAIHRILLRLYEFFLTPTEKLLVHPCLSERKCCLP